MTLRVKHKAGAVAAIAAALAACGESQPAGPATWTHPDGLYAFDYPGDWTASDTSGGPSAAIVHNGDSENPGALQCTVTIAEQNLGQPFTQTELNAGLAQMTRVDFERDIANRTSGRGAVHEFAQTVVDGVTAVRARYEVDIASERLESRHVQFWLPSDGGFAQHNVACAGPNPLNAEDGAALDAALDSLRIE